MAETTGPASAVATAQPQPGTAPPDVQAQGAGVQKLLYLMSQSAGGPPPPAQVAQLLQANPADRAAMIQTLQQSFGNAYTQTVLTQAQAAPSGLEPSAIGAPGNGISTPALPQAPKNPADKMTSGLTPAEQAKANAEISPPASIYNDGNPQNGAERSMAPPQPTPAPGTVRLPPDSASVTPNGTRTTVLGTTTTPGGSVVVPGFAQPGPKSDTNPVAPEVQNQNELPLRATIPMGPTVTTGQVKTVQLPGTDNSPEAQQAALTRYRAAVGAALDEQIAALDPKTTNIPGVPRPAMPADPSLNPQQAHDDLVAAKAKLATATKEDLDAIVVANKLRIDSKDDVRVAASVTNTAGGNIGGLVDPNAPLYQNNTKTASVSSAPGMPTTIKTTDSTNEIGLKGANVVRGSGTTTINPDGSSNTQSGKASLTGGIQDPLKVGASATSATQNANGGSQVTVNAGATVGNGFAGGTGGVAYNRLDPSKNPNPPPAAATPAAATPAAATPAAATPAPDPNLLKKAAEKITSASASGKAGIVNNTQGVGVQASLDDARLDLGNKQVAAGAYGSADATMQMLVTPTDDGGCTIALTYVVRGKLGAFAGKRDPNDPVTAGNEGHGGADAYGEASRTVTKSRKLSKDEATAVLGDLDKLSSNVGGKKTFGVRAEALAYTRVFGGSLADLGNGGEANKAGETVSKIDEKGFGADGKLGGSTGEGGGRSGADVSVGFEKVKISGYKETATTDAVTRSIVFGGRTSVNGSVTGSEGPAGMSVGGSQMDQSTRTYVFTVPKDKPDLLAQVRAIQTEADAQKFAKDHPELANGKVDGQTSQTGSTVGANLGPIAVKGGTTSTVDQNVANGQHTEIGPDGKPIVKKDLSGMEDGSRKDDASLSVAGVTLSQASSTTTSHGAVGPNGQASLDVTTSSQSSTTTPGTVLGNANAVKQTDKADLGAQLLTGGPMALVKKLAEKVGETDTVGAHFDDAAFNQLVGVAQSDQKRWNDAILVDYRSEWFALRNQLVSPHPPQAWLDQDDSDGHIASMQLARMKSLATFISVAGEKGQAAISHVRGEYGANAIGQTVSFPPSLQDQKPVFDSLAKQVEGLRGTLLGFVQQGNEQGGNDTLSKLTTDLKTLHDKILNAPDHSDPTLGIRAANGINDMIQKVGTWQPKFVAAVKAKTANESEQQIEAALDNNAPSATAVAATAAHATAQNKEQAYVAARQKTDAMTPPAPNASDKEWAEYNKKLAASVAADTSAQQDMKQSEQSAADKAAADAKAAAEPKIPASEQECADVKGKAFGLLDQAVNKLPTGHMPWNSSDSDTFDLLIKLGTLMHQWEQQWETLRDLYKDAQRDPQVRKDLQPGLIGARLAWIAKNEYVRTATAGTASDLKSQWGWIGGT